MKLKLVCLMATLLFSNHLLADDTQWGYQGNISPEHWGELSNDFTKCKTGKHQSPINITKTQKLHHTKLNVHYDLTAKELINNGHTIQVIVKSNDDYLTYDHEKYYLKQFHFHSPSENLIKGKSYPLEVHFVHASKEGKLLVLAVMAKQGKTNTELAKAWRLINTKPNQIAPIDDPFDINDFLPNKKSYYHFEGSLTTPPCTEDVNWLLLKQPVEVSKTQIEQFQRIMGHANNRPVQPLNDREVDE